MGVGVDVAGHVQGAKKSGAVIFYFVLLQATKILIDFLT